ncbi:MAG: pirin family protein [Chloroflexi bacterium]|nr:pirin family protein [Chloroflexota bacterium]
MIQVRKKDEIFRIREDWFEGYWHFSFGIPPNGFHDPENTNFGTLRVFNIDTLVPGGVWPMHSHRDIEVITYCLEGQFQHADQDGKGGVLKQGDVQHTTVGSSMFHEEINHRQDIPMTFLQIWITPRERGLRPTMEQRAVEKGERLNRFLTVVSGTDPGALSMQQDAEFVVAALESGQSASYELAAGQGAYLYVVSGRAGLAGHALGQGDAAKIPGEPSVVVKAEAECELAMVAVRV